MTTKVYVITVENPQDDPNTYTFAEGADVEIVQIEESTYPFSKWCGSEESESTIGCLEGHLSAAKNEDYPAAVRAWYLDFARRCVEYNRSSVDEFDVDWDALELRRYREGVTWYTPDGEEA